MKGHPIFTLTEGSRGEVVGLRKDRCDEATKVWAEPLTERERIIVQKALDEGDPLDMRMCLEHCLRILDAQNRVRVAQLIERVTDGMPEMPA